MSKRRGRPPKWMTAVKRRGRPPGSKNKTDGDVTANRIPGVTVSFRQLSVTPCPRLGQALTALQLGDVMIIPCSRSKSTLS